MNIYQIHLRNLPIRLSLNKDVDDYISNPFEKSANKAEF